MKKIIALILSVSIFLGLCSPAFAQSAGTTVYYINSENGSDENSGTSPEQAWKTISRAYSQQINNGDKILLSRGCSFNETLVLGLPGGINADNITVGAYGTGDLPTIEAAEGSEIFGAYVANLSGCIIENLHFTRLLSGIFVCPINGYIQDSTQIRDCVFDNICNTPSKDYSGNPCIGVNMDTSGAKTVNLHMDNLSFSDCGRGIEVKGISRESNSEYFVSEEKTYHSNMLIENITMNNVLYDDIILGSLRSSTVTHCRLINTCTRSDFCTAPLWMHHCDSILVEFCEISGANGQRDGMAIDFDGWTTNSTYQYIYSHDNKRFMRNCVFDSETKNRNNTVRYCLSVNDNRGINLAASRLFSDRCPSFGTMENLNFSNNTLINCTDLSLVNTRNTLVKNNIFIGKGSISLRAIIGNLISSFKSTVADNCYVKLPVPPGAKGTIRTAPGFVGGDTYSPASYLLKDSQSPLGFSAGDRSEEFVQYFSLNK